MWNHYITFFYILIAIRYISCCECNLNHTDLYQDKRQLIESEEFTATEYTETDTKETTLEMFSTSTDQYQTINLDVMETTTESNESVLGIFEIEVNKSQITPDENNTLDYVFDISENSSEVIEPMINETLNKYESDFLSDNETTSDKRKEAEKLSEQGETVEQSYDDLKKKCRHYKNGNSFKLDKMADTWQVVYYRLPNKMKCFKIDIKPVKRKFQWELDNFFQTQEQQSYAKLYGSFNDTIDWERCFLEITSTETAYSGRRHFLQGGKSDRGAMENVIIDEEYDENATYLTLHSEGGDQWLVFNNLLLMRDCETGDLVVFTRYPMLPKKTDVMVALRKFGENNPKGTTGCDIEKFWQTYEDESHENHSVQRREEMFYN